MVTKYKEFICENVEPCAVFPENYEIVNYEITSDGLDVYQNVELINKGLIKIPFKFKKISGDLLINNNNLTTLENCPQEIGHFDCSNNKLSNLLYSPEKIQKSFNCLNNNLTSLEFGPRYVRYNYICDIEDITEYPLCIIGDDIITYKPNNKIMNHICYIIKLNKKSFLPYINNNDKKGFHKKLIEFDNSLLKYYTSWNPFDSKNTKLLL